MNIKRAVISLLKKIDQKYDKITKEAINSGLKSQQLCRNQHLSEKIISNLPYSNKPKQIILDVGHNPDAIVNKMIN